MKKQIYLLNINAAYQSIAEIFTKIFKKIKSGLIVFSLSLLAALFATSCGTTAGGGGGSGNNNNTSMMPGGGSGNNNNTSMMPGGGSGNNNNTSMMPGGNGGNPNNPGGGGGTPSADTDGDGVNNSLDIDDDGDGLIEINSIAMLYNMRFVLNGSSYRTNASAMANTMGGTTRTTQNVANCGTGVFLCGYELTQNIDFSSITTAQVYFNRSSGGWQPIGSTSGHFTAIFEGNGNTITGLFINRSTASDVGFFGVVSNAQIRNVHFARGSITGMSDVGTFVGELGRGSLAILNSSNSGNVSGGGSSIGGFIGRSEGNTIITASNNQGPIVGTGTTSNNIGGMIGIVSGGSSTIITASYNKGSISGMSQLGGFIGSSSVTIAITACYNTGNITATTSTTQHSNMGGFIGNFTGTSSIVAANYNAGNISAPIGGGKRATHLAGIIGRFSVNNGITLSANYNVGNIQNTGNDRSVLNSKQIATPSTGGINAIGNSNYGFGRFLNASGVQVDGSSALPTIALNTLVSGGSSIAINPDNIDPDHTAALLTAATASNAGTAWNMASLRTAGAWMFRTGRSPILRYNDYDGTGTMFHCAGQTAGATSSISIPNCGSAIPGQ